MVLIWNSDAADRRRSSFTVIHYPSSQTEVFPKQRDPIALRITARDENAVPQGDLLSCMAFGNFLLFLCESCAEQSLFSTLPILQLEDSNEGQIWKPIAHMTLRCLRYYADSTQARNTGGQMSAVRL